MTIRHIQSILSTACLITALTLSGCGGGGDSDEPLGIGDGGSGAVTTLLEGRVADGYLVNARVFLDRNVNKRPDPGEPQTMTGPGGRYVLSVPFGEEQIYPVVAQVIGGQTLDEDDNALVPYGYTLETPIGRHDFISPITTQIKQEYDKNGIFQLEDAANLVRTRFALPDNITLYEDYIAAAIENPAQESAWRKTHDTARIMAQLRGALLDEIRRNLGGNIPAENYHAACILVGDLVLQHANEIAAALDSSLVQASGVTPSVINGLLARIDLSTLNYERLELYRRLLSNRPNLWDTQPPRILQHSPAQGTSVPTNSGITITFDEALNPESIKNNSIQVQGAGRHFTGEISYDASAKKLMFVPHEALYALTQYTVVVAGSLTDMPGNAMGAPQSWTFSTIFDQEPPALPDF